jgi:hypothetical protein
MMTKQRSNQHGSFRAIELFQAESFQTKTAEVRWDGAASSPPDKRLRTQRIFCLKFRLLTPSRSSGLSPSWPKTLRWPDVIY